MKNNYKTSYTLYSRFQTPLVTIGTLHMGADTPIVIQSMTNTDTNSVDDTVLQCIRMFDAGADMVRITAQGEREANVLKHIKDVLRSKGYSQPLVADIHFNPKAALVAAEFVEKVRINPGNYVTLSSIHKTEYSQEEYDAELLKIEENIRPLLEVCSQHNTAIRIGVNHGSLSQRIVSKYGDTPLGMVMSMMEFLRICKKMNFSNVVCSIKASNTRIMVYATRLLAQTMLEEQCVFPIHLGVTEAGAGEDGRIKSAVGIGTLLLEGIGDTIRVSLTEAPEYEIPVCKEIIRYRDTIFSQNKNLLIQHDVRKDPFSYSKVASHGIYGIGGNALPIVVASSLNVGADWVLFQKKRFIQEDGDVEFAYICLEDLQAKHAGQHVVIEIEVEQIFNLHTKYLPDDTILVLKYGGTKMQYWIQKLYAELEHMKSIPAIILRLQYDIEDFEDFQIRAAMDAGPVFIDGFCDGLWIENPNVNEARCVSLALSILQASRSRFSKTEYIACPSCGRTLFNIEKALHDVQKKTNHLKGLKIAVMGCIVNGPGEMADADYGYVGAGRGLVHLYKKQELILKSIPESQAVDALIELIKNEGDWKEE